MTSKQNSNPTALLGEKLAMTQVWDENGYFVPVTVVDVRTNVVTQIRNQETDGYDAVQLAFGEVDPRKVSKPLRGHFDKAGVTPRKNLCEVSTTDAAKYELGQELAADSFKEGQLVDVSGTTKGKGFAGVMKRHGFQGVSSSHGEHKNHRKPGSVGACATPGRVFKGMRMAGRMGHDHQTVQNLKVYRVDTERGVLYIKGAVPGPKGGIVLVKSATKGAA
ncbi:MAG: 50S ribosomal protein L3 [Candidatus Ancillula sp.]|jgi:large subunit ribosomal protein L3|nr:50S ribosomal protein L3 [Candidatus Ancillula sp.]